MFSPQHDIRTSPYLSLATQPQPTTFLQPTTTNHPLSAANNHNPTSFHWRTQIQWLEASTSSVRYFVVHATLFCHHLTGWPSCHHGSCRLPLATHLHTLSPPAIDPILALPLDLQPWVSILFSMIQIIVVFQSAMLWFFCLGDLYWELLFVVWSLDILPGAGGLMLFVLLVWCCLCCWGNIYWSFWSGYSEWPLDLLTIGLCGVEFV